MTRLAWLLVVGVVACNDGRGTGGGGDLGVDGARPAGEDPDDCAAAAASKAYVGCDYWPTVVGNHVWSIFDYTVVVANPGTQPADVTVDGPNGTHQTATVAPSSLAKIYLPWVADLKGGDFDECVYGPTVTASVRHNKGAYHLVSSRPVTVYQFSALEYKGAGGPTGKSWGGCPGELVCPNDGLPAGCFSYSNDASLLLPSTALTGNYRVSAYASGTGGTPTYVSITGTSANTNVTVTLSKTAATAAGTGLPPHAAGSTFTFNIDDGDVVQLLATSGDLSGTLIKADDVVQVITGAHCAQVPVGYAACDHLEESTFPVETLGQDYVVTVPTGPHGVPVGHVVRIYGNFDGTSLTFEPPIAGAPSSIKAGEVIDLGQVKTDFRVRGDHSFAVGSFMLGAELVDPNASVYEQEGDPSQSMAVAVEQFRQKYVFLAPNDYDSGYVDVVAPAGATLTLDEMSVSVAATPIGGGEYGVVRVSLPKSGPGSHVLTASAPVGIQVLGYGLYTSYQYPGGLNLGAIAPVPVL